MIGEKDSKEVKGAVEKIVDLLRRTNKRTRLTHPTPQSSNTTYSIMTNLNMPGYLISR